MQNIINKYALKIFNFNIFVIFFILIISNAHSQNNKDSLKTITAQKGEGIYKILRDNNLDKSYYQKFIELNKTKIKQEDAIIEGEIYYLPLKQEINNNDNIVDSINCINNKIKNDSSKFKYADTIINNFFEGAVIYLISGHGGPDPGAISEYEGKTISEDEYAYDICLRIAKSIEEQSGTVYMIIDDPNDGIRDDKYLPIDYDEYCYPNLDIPRNVNDRLKQRSNAVNQLYANHKDNYKYQRVIEIHLDSRSVSKKIDVFFYYYPESKKGKQTAETIQKVFFDKYAKHQPNRGYEGSVTTRKLFVMKNTIPPLIFIELGNIQNEQDRKRFLIADNRQALAKWITEGLLQDFNNSK